MDGGQYLAVVENSALENNPAVVAELRREDGTLGRALFFVDHEEAVEWCDRMTRIGKRELVLVPADDTADADVRVVAQGAGLTDDLGGDDGDEEGGFGDFLDDAF